MRHIADTRSWRDRQRNAASIERTAAEVRHIFTKNDGNLGTSGAVAWLFERRGVVLVPADGVDEDELTLAAA